MAQLIAIPQLLPPMVVFADSRNNVDFGATQIAINALAGMLMVIASRVLPVLIVLIGEGYPTLSNRDNVTNNYLRLLLVLWLVFCVRNALCC